MPVAEAAHRSPYRGYRFLPEIIAHAVWLYFRFHLSFRDVQDLLTERDLIVSHETIRQWCTKFGVLDGEGGAEPRVVITDKLASYPPAIKRVLRPQRTGVTSG